MKAVLLQQQLLVWCLPERCTCVCTVGCLQDEVRAAGVTVEQLHLNTTSAATCAFVYLRVSSFCGDRKHLGRVSRNVCSSSVLPGLKDTLVSEDLLSSRPAAAAAAGSAGSAAFRSSMKRFMVCRSEMVRCSAAVRISSFSC